MKGTEKITKIICFQFLVDILYEYYYLQLYVYFQNIRKDLHFKYTFKCF